MKTLLKSILPLWLLLTGCSLDIPYENQFSDPDAISTTSTARELLATAYSQLPNLEYDLSILSDDFEPTYWARTNPTLLNSTTGRHSRSRTSRRPPGATTTPSSPQ